MNIIIPDSLSNVKSVSDSDLANLIGKIKRICLFSPDSAGRTPYMLLPNLGCWAPRPLRVAAVSVQQRIEEAGNYTQPQLEALICDYCRVQHVLQGMMLPPGVYSIGGEEWLAATDLPMWRESRMGAEAHPMPNGIYVQAIKDILGEDGARRLFAWLAGARDRIVEWRGCQQISHDLPALAIIGRQGCGKTLLLKQILPRVLGARGMDFSRRLSGETGFSGHIETTPLLTIDDSRGEAGFKARKIATKVLKQGLYGEGFEIHLKNHEPVCIKLPHCMVFCTNEDASSLRALPVLSGDDEHKMLILKAEGEMKGNETSQQKRKWNEDFANEAEIQGFIDYIDQHGREREKESQQEREPNARKTPLWNPRQYLNGGCFNDNLKKKITAVNPSGVVADAVISAVANAKLKDNKTSSALRLSDIMNRIEDYASWEPKKNFRIAFPFDADKKEALSEYLSMKNIIAKKDSHLHAPVYDLSSLKYDY